MTAAASGLFAAGSAVAVDGPAIAWSPVTSSGSYNFGVVDAASGKTATQKFTLTNSGSSATAVLMMSLSGSSAFKITANSCSGTSLGPKKSCSVTVQYVPTASGQSDSATLTATGIKPAASVSLALTGNGGNSSLAWSPTTSAGSYDFGTVDAGNNLAKTFKLTNSGTGTSPALTAVVTGGAFSIGSQTGDDTCTGTTLAAGGSCVVTVVFAPSFSGDSDSGSLSAGGASLGLTGTGGGPLFAWSQAGTTTSSFDYGSVPAGNIVTQTFTLTYLGGGTSGTLTTSASNSDGSAFSIGTQTGEDTCTGASLEHGATCSVTVYYEPSNELGENDSGTLSAGGTDLTLTGTGTLPALTLGPPASLLRTDQLDGTEYNDAFGQVSSATQTLTITNPGPGTTQALNLSALSGGSDGNAYSISNDGCTGTSLASGATCTFDLTYTATGPSGSEEDGQLTVRHLFLPNVPYIDVGLTGQNP